ncbi:hypothetical protein OS493_005922 [Desmophyllum pertusum]|uniref:Uncharacterized protein n=1 Tax=Desmophyllum pertusum TaxID=174260 RepID=A0A9W9YFI0_9CNID|nr:hypothetical protein OS493_005922 [Desmophyllum pertusum]
MGCSAGKHMTTSPEVSSSSHSVKENGSTVHTPDVPRHSLESSTALNCKRKDSSNSISSVKEPDIPEPKTDMFSILSKDKNEDRILSRRPVPLRSNDNCCTAPKAIPLNQIRLQMTRSQLEFFRMLDQKIDEGPDYVSEADS